MWTRKRTSAMSVPGLILVLIALTTIVTPAIAGPDYPSWTPTMAQVVNAGSVTNKSVGDVVEAMRQWKIVTLSISMILVIALLFAGGLLRPGGYAKAGLRNIHTLPAVVWIFAAFVVLLAMSSGPQVVSKIQWVQDQQYTKVQLRAINDVTTYVFGIVAGVGMLFILKRSAGSEEDGHNGLGLSPLDIPVGLGCFVLAYPFIELMNMLGVFAYTQTQGMAPTGMGHPTLEMLTSEPRSPWVWAIVGGAVIGASVVEELVFRVFLQGALLKWLKSPWLAIIISAILFAALHRAGEEPVPWHALTTIFAVGLTCGVAYERTRRVGVPITMHICFNALNVMLALMVSTDAAQAGV